MPKGGASARAIAAHAGRARRTTDGFVSDVRRSRPSEGSEGARRRVLAWHRRRSRASGVQRRLLLQPRGVALAGGRWNAAAMSAPTAAVSAGASTLPRAGAPARPRAVSVDLARASVAARVAPPARAPGGSRRVAAAAGKDQRNPTVGAISDANATRSDARVSWDGVFSTKELAEVDDASLEDDAVEVEAAPLAPAAGFWVRAKLHDAGCSCAVCAQLRDLIANAPEPLAVPVTGEEADPILIAHDGGFIVGKHQQKHHVGGCKCPNCNHQKFRRDNGTAKCVHIPPELLPELVGPESMHQNVMDKQAELDRRAKIGAANKGKSAWNKGRSHSPETIAKIKANTAKAMQNPEVKRRMREAASKTQHSETTKRKIRRTVRDSAHKKMVARNEEKSAKMGIRRGKVGQVSIGTFARRISAVQTVRFGVWSKMDIEAHEERKKLEAREQKRLEREAKKRKAREEKLAAKAKKGTARSTRGVPKSAAHRKAISDALKAKWEDPEYVSLQKKANRARKRSTTVSSLRDDAARNKAVSEAEKKRSRLVAEMKEIYTKASVAVRALEERKSAGLDVDEVMLQKALSAVAETRKVLESLGQVPDTDPRRMKKKPAKRDAPPEGPRVVHVVDGEVVEPEPAEGGEGQGDDGIDRV